MAASLRFRSFLDSPLPPLSSISMNGAITHLSALRPIEVSQPEVLHWCAAITRDQPAGQGRGGMGC